MAFMNEYDINDAVVRYREHPVLGPATRTLANLKDAVNSSSDGWPYWRRPTRAARRLMNLITPVGGYYRDAEREDATMAQLRAALTPIKAFRTQSGLKFEIDYGKPVRGGDAQPEPRPKPTKKKRHSICAPRSR